MIWKFKPVIRRPIWGGARLSEIAPASGLVRGEKAGEVWVLSDVPGSETRVVSGPDAGLTPGALIARYGAKFLGSRNLERYGDRFPLLVKIIDAGADLSVQVHPDDSYARSHGEPYGKSEMWYVMDAAPGARLACGLSRVVGKDEFRQLAETGGIEEALRFCEVRAGEVYEIPAGRIHALGAGCLVAEIQQSSDTTYRIYDYRRKDSEGRERQLHIEEASEVAALDDLAGEPRAYDGSGRDVEIVDMPEFEVRRLTPGAGMRVEMRGVDSFRLLMPVKGSGVVRAGEEELAFEVGESVVLSAEAAERCGGYELRGTQDFQLLESYI